MKLTIISKNYGTQTINTESFIPELASKSSTIFKIVEHLFNEWFTHYSSEGSPIDAYGMYFGDYDQPAIYSVSGAVRDGIRNLINEAKELGKAVITTKDIINMDIECAFE